MVVRHKLSEKACKSISEVGVHSDGDGLYLRVRVGGSKSWIFIYRWDGKRAELGLGGYGSGAAPVSLALAREKAEAVRQQLARGEDPKAERRSANPKTFKDIMDDVIKTKTKSFKNAKHRAQWRTTLDTYATRLHDIAISKVSVDDVVETLKPIWEEIPETADRLRMRIAAVMDAAKARGLYVGDNPAAWRGNLQHLMSDRQTLSRGHHAALAYADVPVTMKALRASLAVSARAVEFACLTGARSGEVRGAAWPEIDLDAALWIIPKERMKAGREHRVPLCERAIEILRERKELATSEIVFEGGNVGSPISDTAMVKVLRAASPDKSITLHGLRSSLRDWAGDETHHPRDVIEMALAHVVKDKTEAAYRRKDALEKRRLLMKDWAEFCGSAN
ncbi:integrase arm-type DNA-binding domain-containing protein [Rhizobium leguminosarum]|uniref:tyrosine-type recombinase/integrase n=1 Tax=Rhizobium leguminosarum TaxID=384 RepID=UPI0024A8D5CB|nr:site-specific integrase [Rhizobium leguminosarum]MDI5926448.1 integrase arm-type DNA-binding domain-containing protein [Rhizobium leguminosarum]